MKAIILAAGYGNRMKPLTNNTHKTLLSIADETIISNIVSHLFENGISEIVMVTGYLCEEVESYLTGNFPELKFEFVRNDKYKETNNIYSLALAFESLEINDDMLVIESDLILDKSILPSLLNSTHDNVALVDRYRTGMDGTVVTVNNEMITNVIPPHLQDDDFDFSDKYKTLNIYKFSKDFCNNKFKKLLTYYASVIDDNCYYELILGVLIYLQNEDIFAVNIEGSSWAEVDDPNDLSVAEFIFNKKQRRQILDQSYGGYWNYDVLDFCFIRNMYFPSHSMNSELKNNVVNLIHNYGSSNKILREKISYVFQCEAERGSVLNGAAQIFPYLRDLFKGKQGLIPTPTFGEYYSMFDSFDTYKFVEDSDWCSSSFGESFDVVVFVNPNNPTGSLIKTEEIWQYAKENAGKFILVDESFIEFSSTVSMIDKLEQSPLENILVIKSLSKSYGFPGVRLGYCYSCNADLNKKIQEWLPVWNINSPAEFMLESILKHKNEFQSSLELTKRDREKFREQLSVLKCVDFVFPSEANFLLVMLKGISGEEVADYLLDSHRVYVRDSSKKFDDGESYIRLAVRSEPENSFLVSVLSQVTIDEQ